MRIMLTLAVLLQVAGLIFTFTLGVPGYFIGPLTVIAGGLLYRRELRRRKAYAANPPPAMAAPVPPRRPVWQRFLIGLGAVLVVFAGLFALVWRLTAALADTADHFFLALSAGDLDKARGYLAEDFRAATSEADLRNFVERSALMNYESASWTSRRIENASGWLAGNIKTASGGSIPMEISLVHENGGWKILSLRKPEAGILSQEGLQPPAAAEQLRITRDATAKLADAITRRDFNEFHGAISALWRKQVTVAQLVEAFRSFTDQQADLSMLKGMDARIQSAAFGDDGAFEIAGSYPTKPNTVVFRYRYVYEGVDWKLIGVNLEMK
jgi:hypothetical protein